MLVRLLSVSSIRSALTERASASPVAISAAGMISLAVAMGVGRFAFTPLFPLMVRDGLLTSDTGALLAASNYLGYLVGAMLVARLRLVGPPRSGLGLSG